jgi:hypothetical protein
MDKIKENLKAINGLVRSAKKDVVEGQGRLDQAEQKVNETMALLDARRQNIKLDLGPKARIVRSKE